MFSRAIGSRMTHYVGLLFLILSMHSIAEVVVVVHPSNDALIDKSVLKNIYMGRTTTFPNGRKALPIDIESGDIKKNFLQVYLQKSQGSMDSYWARMIFSGSASPPKVLVSQEAVKKMVAGNPDAIGYIDSSLIDDSVKKIDLK